MLSLVADNTFAVLNGLMSQQSCSPGQEIVMSPDLHAPMGWPGAGSAAKAVCVEKSRVNKKSASFIV